MIQDMQLRGLVPGTQKTYVNAIRELAKYYHRSADLFSEEDIRDYFIYLREQKNLAGSTMRNYLFAVKFLYRRTLHRQWPILDLIRIRSTKTLPVVLSRQEVRCLLKQVRRPAAQMALILMYSCGLRLSEALRLHCQDIDSERMVVCVRNAKRAKDRYVPLPERTLERLRAYWFEVRPKTWLLPTLDGLKPMHEGTIRKSLTAALAETPIRKQVTCHTLRHSYATHLMEQGVDMRVIQALLGHANPKTTFMYMHLTQSTMLGVHSKINDLMDKL
jgi:site-specific recombinase XerD